MINQLVSKETRFQVCLECLQRQHSPACLPLLTGATSFDFVEQVHAAINNALLSKFCLPLENIQGVMEQQVPEI